MSLMGTYLVNGEAGNVGMPGAPILHFSLVVVAASGKVSGHATITQAIAPPYGIKEINNVTGRVRYTGFGQYTKIVSLKGTYDEPLPPPAIGSVAVPFEAHFAIDDSWNGRGGFSCGMVNVDNVPVVSSSAPDHKPPIVMMYGPALQEAAASGDLSRMKALAAQAEAHLQNSQAISEGLTKLQAAIKKQEKTK